MDGSDNDNDNDMTHPAFLTHWKWGLTEPILTRASKSSHILTGDLLFLDEEGKARPARDFPQGEDFEARFALRFLGVAASSSRLGDENVINVYTTGTFEYQEDSGLTCVKHQLGDYMGIVPGESRALAGVESARKAIGRIVHTENVPFGWVYVGLISTIIHGGVPGSDPTHRKD